MIIIIHLFQIGQVRISYNFVSVAIIYNVQDAYGDQNTKL